MQFYRKKGFGLYGLIIAAALSALIVVCAFGCTGPEQQGLPVPSCADIALTELEITEEVTREAGVTEGIAPEIEITEEAEVIEAFAAKTEIEETTESADEPDFMPYDIPLSAELQQYTFDLCGERGLDFEIVLALMYAESSYRPDIISKTNDYGLMQLNKAHHGWLTAELGITDFLDAEQNINAGTFLLANISNKYPDIHQMLMTYNFGEAGAKRCWNKGIYSSKYSRKITAKADELKICHLP
jgi:hypothetical protein